MMGTTNRWFAVMGKSLEIDVSSIELSIRSNFSGFMTSLYVAMIKVRNRGTFSDLLECTANMDEKLREHLTNSKVGRNTSKDIQNDLLDSVYEVYLAQVESEISFCEFVAIQPDETAESVDHVSPLRETRPPGRAIHSLVNEENRSAVGISEILQNILRLYNIREK